MSAEGLISKAQETWRQMLATCDAFLKWGSAGYPWDTEEALQHIHHDRLPSPANNAAEYTAAERANYLPFAIVWTDPVAGYTLEPVSTADPYWLPSGVLVAEFYRAAPTPPDDESFRNFMGSLLSTGNLTAPGLLELARLGGQLALGRLQVFGPVISVPEEFPEFGPVQTMMLHARW